MRGGGRGQRAWQKTAKIPAVFGMLMLHMSVSIYVYVRAAVCTV